jgi:D-glycero-alpha-D-manno-heptose 1-phosphate guanylyltransferase
MEAVILAGGIGTRLGHLTKDLPKPMLSFNGKPFLQHLMDFWISQGIDSFILSVGYRYEKIKDYFGNEYREIPIRYSIEKEPLGTGGALALSITHLKTNGIFLLLNGDTFFAINLKELMSEHEKRSANITMSLFQSKEENRYERIELTKENEVTGIIDRTKTSKVDFVNGGVYCIESRFLKNEWDKSLRKHSLENDDLVEWIKNKKRIYGCHFKKEFMDIGTPKDYEMTELFLKQWVEKKGETHA